MYEEKRASHLATFVSHVKYKQQKAHYRDGWKMKLD